MKIVNRKQFISMSPGTLFIKYKPCIFGPLCEKRETIGDIDFWYINLTNSVDAAGTDEFFKKLTLAEREGSSVDLRFDEIERDGAFNDDQLFAVYERNDVLKLIKALDLALNLGY